MRRPSLSLVLALVGIVSLVTLVACRRGGGTETGAPVGQPADPAAAPAVAEDKFGVSECDDFVQAYKECVKQTADEGTRSYLESNLEQMLARFRQLAATGQTHVLAETCLMTRQIMKPHLIAHGCLL